MSLFRYISTIICVTAGSIGAQHQIRIRETVIRYDTIEEFNVDSKAEYTA